MRIGQVRLWVNVSTHFHHNCDFMSFAINSTKQQRRYGCKQLKKKWEGSGRPPAWNGHDSQREEIIIDGTVPGYGVAAVL
jgi:hypothetical protein